MKRNLLRYKELRRDNDTGGMWEGAGVMKLLKMS